MLVSVVKGCCCLERGEMRGGGARLRTMLPLTPGGGRACWTRVKGEVHGQEHGCVGVWELVCFVSGVWGRAQCTSTYKHGVGSSIQACMACTGPFPATAGSACIWALRRCCVAVLRWRRLCLGHMQLSAEEAEALLGHANNGQEQGSPHNNTTPHHTAHSTRWPQSCQQAGVRTCRQVRMGTHTTHRYAWARTPQAQLVARS